MSNKELSENPGLRPPHAVAGPLDLILKKLIRAPLAHRLVSRNLMLLSLTGRKSGRTYTVPLSYVRDGDTITAFTSVANAWPKNLKGSAPVRLLLRGVWTPAVAEPFAPAAEDLQWYYRRLPRDAKYHYVKLDRDRRPDPDDLELALREQLMIRARISAAPSA